MNTRTLPLGLRIIALTMVLFALYSVDFLGLSLSDEARTAPGTILLVSFLHTVVVVYPIMRSRLTGWPLVGAIFLAFYGVTTLMVAIEAVYLPESLPAAVVRSIIINGAITAAAFSYLAVLLCGRMAATTNISPVFAPRLPPLRWTGWAKRLVAAGLAWAFLFVMFGTLVFLPLARCLAPEALAEYTNIQIPPWVLPFQVARGMLWALTALPVIYMVEGRWWEPRLSVALLFSVLMGSNLLRAMGSLPAGIGIAHFVEVTCENFVFGWIVASLFRGRHDRRTS